MMHQGIINLKRDILIIEDSQATSMLIAEFLKKLGYEKIHSAKTGNDGIQEFRNLVNNGTIPIILLDYSLPDTNANEIMNKIFQIIPDVKIILETAEERDEDVVKEALRQGAYMYLQKPIRFENIKETMRTIENENENLEDGLPESGNMIDIILTSSTRISVMKISEQTQISQEKVLAYLQDLVKEGKAIQTEKIKEISCNSCGSVNITQNFICPSCRGLNFKQGKLIEHFSCGNVSLQEDYEDDTCPKCHKKIKIIGVDYRSIENYYECNDCNNKFPEPNVDYICMRCNNSFRIDNATWITSEGFKPKNST